MEFVMVELLEVKVDKNENSEVETNITASEIELIQGKSLTGVNHLQDEIKFLRKELGNKTEVIKNTLPENINFSEKISQIPNSPHNDYEKSLTMKIQNVNSHKNSFIKPRKKSIIALMITLIT